MKLPPSDYTETSAATGQLEELSSAVRARRLVGLLRGAGLTRNTIEELLRPESASCLNGILTDHLFPDWDEGAHKDNCHNEEYDPGSGPDDDPCQGGKVLAFRKKETRRT